jgi:putative PIN family toxin of toxin-antitoxin system
LRVFLDTNVLVSAFATRGLCADVVRTVLVEHELLVGEVVLRELREVLIKRIRLPHRTIEVIEELLREQVVIPNPRRPADIDVRDQTDRWILASAIEGGADVLVTGDHDLLELGRNAPLLIVDPRGFWSLITKNRPI